MTIYITGRIARTQMQKYMEVYNSESKRSVDSYLDKRVGKRLMIFFVFYIENKSIHFVL